MEYGWLSLVPPLVAIALAIITKEVFISLGIGIFTGAFILSDFKLMATFDKIFSTLFTKVGDPEWNIPILAFLLFLGALTALMSASGGSRSFGEWVIKRIKTPQGASWMVFISGIIIFIDDYFNSLTVGNFSRPVTDKHNISRAKLAYILDSTAAPVVVLAPLSSWGAFIISLIGVQLAKYGVEKESLTAFVQMIPMNFYAILSITMVALIIFLKIDFGPMAKAEKRAINGDLGVQEGDVREEIKDFGKGKVFDLLLPILVLIITTVTMMIYTGGYFANEITLLDAFLETDVAKSLVYGSVFTLIFTAILYLSRRVIPVKEFIPTTITGMKSMFNVILILALAWTIGGIVSELGTGDYLASFMDGSFPVWLIPAMLFVISGLMAFSTGTSWGTFTIMLPLAADVIYRIEPELLLPSMAAVLAGAVFGDHSSPISDTTILSSAGAGAKHIEHVNTQLPYALLVASVSLIGYIILGLTTSVLLSLSLSIIILVSSVIVIKKVKLFGVS